MKLSSRACCSSSLTDSSGSCITHVQQVCPQVREHADHPRHHRLGIGDALQVTISAVDDLGPDQHVSNGLRAAQADLDQITPAAAHPAQPDPGPVTSERPLPLAGDELLPPEDFHLVKIVVIHRPNGTAPRPLRHAGCPRHTTVIAARADGRSVRG